jgi:hypothetical protein
MLNEKQQKLFSEILNLNWDYSHETKPSIKYELLEKLTDAKNELRSDMGKEAYDKFMSGGAKLFS